jgi:hypothetical protein
MHDSVHVVFSVCAICGTPVEVEKASTDTNGQAVHEECYAKKLAKKKIIPLDQA